MSDAKIEAALRSCLNSAYQAVLPTHDRCSATPAMAKAIDHTANHLRPALHKRDGNTRREAFTDLIAVLELAQHFEAAQHLRRWCQL